MQGDNFVSRCCLEKGTLWLAVDENGTLWKGLGTSAEELDWQPYDFNQEYQGYYPACRFTAVAWTTGGFLAVGQEEPGGRIVAYSSLRGGVWNSENLVARTPEGPVEPSFPVYDICQDKVSGQTFLLGGSGQVITLNGCPKCVKISHFGRMDILHGQVVGEFLLVTLRDGSQSEIPIHAVSQMHLSREAAEEKHQQGGIYVYVGEEELPESAQRTGIRQCSLAEVNAFLRSCEKERILIFYCQSGVRAEAAAKTARAQGYREAYYL